MFLDFCDFHEKLIKRTSLPLESFYQKTSGKPLILIIRDNGHSCNCAFHCCSTFSPLHIFCVLFHTHKILRFVFICTSVMLGRKGQHPRYPFFLNPGSTQIIQEPDIEVRLSVTYGSAHIWCVEVGDMRDGRLMLSFFFENNNWCSKLHSNSIIPMNLSKCTVQKFQLYFGNWTDRYTYYITSNGHNWLCPNPDVLPRPQRWKS